MSKFQLTTEQQEYFTAVLMLEQICNQNQKYSVLLDGDLSSLEPIFEQMMLKGFVDVSGIHYTPTTKGKEMLANFLEKYSEFLKLYDIFCAVDLGAGSFGFQHFFDSEFEDEERWRMFLKEERFEDLRCAVAAYKGINPIEIIFMSFINEGRFKLTSQVDWAFDLKAGFMWDEIVEIYNSQLTIDQIGFTTGDGQVITGEMVLNDVINQGTDLLAHLLEQEEEMNHNQRSSHSSRNHYHNKAVNNSYSEIYVEKPSYNKHHYNDYYGNSYHKSNAWVVVWY